MLEKSGVNPSLTSYQLLMEDYNKLCYAYNDICQRHPAIFKYDYRLPYKDRLLQSNEVSQQIKQNALSQRTENTTRQPGWFSQTCKQF